MKSVWLLPSLRETERLGAELARACPWGAREPRVLWLSGELGAGKTTLAAALLGALGVNETVRSPSYALIESYPLAAGIAVHLDLYRLQTVEEVEQLGLRDHLNPNTLMLIEWPERAPRALPRADLAATLELEADARVCRLEAHTAAGEAWLAVIEHALPSQI